MIMHCGEAILRNRSGLHARPASDFVLAAKRFESIITIRKAEGGAPVSGKSVVLLLAQGYKQGDRLEISAEGADEKEAVDSLLRLVENGFGE
jgi:phosphocarrier protein